MFAANVLVSRPVQVNPSLLVAIVFPEPDPTATHFPETESWKTALPCVENVVNLLRAENVELFGIKPNEFVPAPVIKFLDTWETAVTSDVVLKPTIPVTLVEKVLLPLAVHVIPSGLVAIVFVPTPPAIHCDPFHVIENPFVENNVVPVTPVQAIPS